MHIDPYLFRPDAVDPATRAANEQLEKLLLAQAPPIHSQVPAAIRAARAGGQGTFGPIVRLPHAETRNIRGPGGRDPAARDPPEGRGARRLPAHPRRRPHVLGSEDMMDPALDYAREPRGSRSW